MHGGDPRAVRNDAGKIHRVDRGEKAPLAVVHSVAESPQLRNGRFLGELLPRDAGNEASAADFAPQFHPAEDPDQLVPRRRGILPRQAVAENDAVAMEELLAPPLQVFIILRRLRLAWKARPAADRGGAAVQGLLSQPEAAAGRFLGSLGNVADGGESVGRNEAQCGELPQCIFQLGRQQAGQTLQFLIKERAASRQHSEHILRLAAGEGIHLHSLPRQQPGEVIPHQQGNGHCAVESRHAGAVLFVPARRAEAAPHRFAGHEQHVQPLRVVLGHAGGKDLLFPHAGGQLEPLQLQHRLAQAGLPLLLLGGMQAMLPREVIEIDFRRDWLDFLPQAVERQPVDTGQEPPLAPLGAALVVGMDARRFGKAAAHRDARAFQRFQRGFHLVLFQHQSLGNVRRRRGTGSEDSATNKLESTRCWLPFSLQRGWQLRNWFGDDTGIDRLH